MMVSHIWGIADEEIDCSRDRLFLGEITEPYVDPGRLPQARGRFGIVGIDLEAVSRRYSIRWKGLQQRCIECPGTNRWIEKAYGLILRQQGGSMSEDILRERWRCRKLSQAVSFGLSPLTIECCL